ncbi:hypothetical protein GCM10010402_34830 [Actinomadura luteofluorescens]|uniref:hypothetical protein n=1 Tax=Actinomadura luteofluorescens TaxID=46163 RepID=UPI002164EE1D|nr:hypothetical protein [Actinomadura glauciflava]MCR3746058.1 hypothetical protein [Actinomadura glauciflava]
MTTLAVLAAPADAAARPRTVSSAELRDVDHVPCTEHIAANAVFHADGASYSTDAQGRPSAPTSTR